MSCNCAPGTPPPAYYVRGQWKEPGFANIVTTTADYVASDGDTGVDARGTSTTQVTLPPNPRQGQQFIVGAIGAATTVIVPQTNITTQSIFGQAGGPPAFVTVAQNVFQIFQASVDQFTGLIVWYPVS